MTDAKNQLEAAIGILRDLVQKRAQNVEELAMHSLAFATKNRDAIHGLTDNITAAILQLTVVAGMLDTVARRLDAHVAALEQHITEHMKNCPPNGGAENGQ